MKIIDLWRERRPQSALARYLLYGVTITLVVVLGVLAVRFLTKKYDDCNKPAAPVEVPNAPPGLVVDAPCTDASAPAKMTPKGK